MSHILALIQAEPLPRNFFPKITRPLSEPPNPSPVRACNPREACPPRPGCVCQGIFPKITRPLSEPPRGVTGAPVHNFMPLTSHILARARGLRCQGVFPKITQARCPRRLTLALSELVTLGRRVHVAYISPHPSRARGVSATEIFR